jgi:DNA-binding IclR family transcriptional regulator
VTGAAARQQGGELLAAHLGQGGAELPLHVSSSGHVLLAFDPRDLQERILAEPLARYTGTRSLTRPR